MSVADHACCACGHKPATLKPWVLMACAAGESTAAKTQLCLQLLLQVQLPMDYGGLGGSAV